MKLLNKVKFKNFVRGNYILNGIAEFYLTALTLAHASIGGGSIPTTRKT